MASSSVFNEGDYAWTMASGALVFMMIPGIVLFYSGLRSQQTSLSLVWVTLMAVSIVFIQWYLFGYSLAFSPFSKNNFIGDLHFAAFINTLEPDAFAGNSAPNTPAYVYGLFQGMFSAFTAALVAGVVAERGRLIPFLVFTLLWATFVYDVIAYWIWNKNGWSNSQGGLDWAGGTPVHICSGGSSLAYALMLKYNRLLIEDRRRFRTLRADTWRAHLFLSKEYRAAMRVIGATDLSPVNEGMTQNYNLMNTSLGTMLVWFGWFGFNAGSELQANSRAASTFMASNLAACSGGITFCLLQKAFSRKKQWSIFGFCTGGFAGLVAITPGAGYVPAWSGLIFGPAAAAGCGLCMFRTDLERRLEEPFVIPVVHGLGGLIGMVFTGFFADSRVAFLDKTPIPGGWLNHNWKQMLWQLAGGFAGLAWSFGISLIILIFLQLLSIQITSLRLRADEPLDYNPVSNPLDLDKLELGFTHETHRIAPITSNESIPEPQENAGTSRRDNIRREPHVFEPDVLLTPEPTPPEAAEPEYSASPQTPQNGMPLIGKDRRRREGGKEVRRTHNPIESIEMSDFEAEIDDHRAPIPDAEQSDN